MAITKEQIIETAESLQAKNINPTMAGVREALGGGSFATISPVLRDWKTSKEQRATVAIEMPSEAKQALERAGVDLWKIITTIATERLLKVQAESEELIENANIERDESMSEIERLESELMEQSTQLIAIQEQNEVLLAKHQKTNDEVIALEIKLAEKIEVENANKSLVAINTRLNTETSKTNDEIKYLLSEKAKLTEKSQWHEMNLAQIEKTLSNTNDELLKSKSLVSKKEKEFLELSDLNHSLDLKVQENQLILNQDAMKFSDLKSDIAEFKNIIKEKDILLLKIENKNGSLAGELKSFKAEKK